MHFEVGERKMEGREESKGKRKERDGTGENTPPNDFWLRRCFECKLN